MNRAPGERWDLRLSKSVCARLERCFCDTRVFHLSCARNLPTCHDRGPRYLACPSWHAYKYRTSRRWTGTSFRPPLPSYLVPGHPIMRATASVLAVLAAVAYGMPAPGMNDTVVSAAGSSDAKLVVAHVIVGNTYPYTSSSWAADIALAHASGIDGFALNIGSDSWQADRIRDAYVPHFSPQRSISFMHRSRTGTLPHRPPGQTSNSSSRSTCPPSRAVQRMTPRRSGTT